MPGGSSTVQVVSGTSLASRAATTFAASPRPGSTATAGPSPARQIRICPREVVTYDGITRMAQTPR